MNVLLVDDSESFLLLLDMFMMNSGHDYELAENGAEALKKLSGKRFDLIFMDCKMPVMNGHETVLAIRASGGEYANIPVICISTHAHSARESSMCQNCRVNDFLCKPFVQMDLMGAIERYGKLCRYST